MAAFLWGSRPLLAAPAQLAAAGAPVSVARCAASGWPTAPHRRHTSVVTAAAATGQGEQQQQHSRQRHRALRDPAKLAGASTHTVSIPDRGGDLSLDTYMRLPTEAYSELDPSMIIALGGSSFLLKVPRVQLFDVWVEPEVVVDVKLAEGPASLIFESGECRLKGSELLQRLELDKRFVLYFHTTLTWQPRQAALGNGGSGSSSGSSTAAPLGSSSMRGVNGSAGSSGQGHISAKAEVQVWSEVVGPFGAIPRPILEATGNTVLGALMRALLPVFMQKLAADYERWSLSPQYRARRAAVSSAAANGGSAPRL